MAKNDNSISEVQIEKVNRGYLIKYYGWKDIPLQQKKWFGERVKKRYYTNAFETWKGVIDFLSDKELKV